MAMSEAELLTVLKNQLGDSIKYANSGFKASYETLYRSYNQEPYGTEIKDRSQVISSDHYDMVESDMPALARIFLGSNDILKYVPLGNNDQEEAEEKTKFANYIVRNQPDSFKIIHDWLKEPGWCKCSVVKTFIEETEQARYESYEDLSEDELAILLQDLESGEDADRVEIESQEKEKNGTFNVRFRIVQCIEKICIANVPPENFIISRGAKNKDSAMIVGDEITKTKGELIAEGYPKDMVKKLTPNTTNINGNTTKQLRFEDQGGWDQKSGYHWTQEEVTIQNLYSLVDVDGDGIPERRFIVKCGEEILENEPYELVPYAILSQILIPHSAIGKSRGEKAAATQKEKTAIKRGIMDNIYAVNRPRMGVDDSDGSIDGGKVNLDDLLTHRIDGIIRTDGPPMNALMPIVTPYIGNEALQVINYIDNEKVQSLGLQLGNQGLNVEDLYKETATRFEGVDSANKAKLELVARVYAETGFRELFDNVIWLAQHHQDTETEILVLGKPMTVNPRGWRRKHYAQCLIGLGAGDNEEMINNLSGIMQIQKQEIMSGSPLADHKKLYNTLFDLIKVMGKPDPSRYFNDPEMPEQTLMAKLYQLFTQNQQLQAQVQNNPLAEAAMVTAKAKLAEVQGKESSQMRQFIMKMAQEDKQFAAELAKDLTEIELKYNSNVPGALT
jgi:hypothetical protein